MKFDKNILRSTQNTVVAGVCGAVSEMFGVEVKIVRIVYLAFTVITAFFLGIFLYLFLMLIIPKELSGEQADELTSKQVDE